MPPNEQDKTGAVVAPLAVSPDEAARMLGISRAHLYNLRASGRLGPRAIRLGRSVRFEVAEIRAWIAAGAPPADRWAAMQGKQ